MSARKEPRRGSIAMFVGVRAVAERSLLGNAFDRRESPHVLGLSASFSRAAA